MEDGKKNSFFSWLSSKIKKKKVIDIKPNDKEIKNQNISKKISENNIKEDVNFKKDFDISQDISIENKNIKKEKIKILNDYSNSIQNTDNIKINFFKRLKKSLNKTKKILGDKINHVFLSKKINDLLFEELEEKMLLADMGINTTNKIISDLIKDTNRKDLKNTEKVYFLLKKKMYSILKKVEKPLEISNHKPFIILLAGVNGTGKTTTVAKLAQKYKSENRTVMLVAADTFRAAGIEQLQILGKLNKIPVIAQRSGSDPAAVIFDGIKSAISKKIDILIIDTAGRLHNKVYLMEELRKIVRVIKKIDCSAPHEKILIVDASNGQNIIQQTEIFHKVLNLTGIIITKLDGTAKGGVIFSLADQFQIPIRYVGIGEKIQDLGVFNSEEFIKIIFSRK